MTLAQLIAEARLKDYMEDLIGDEEYEDDENERYEKADERYDEMMDREMCE